MRLFTSHHSRKHRSLLKYILVAVVLFSVFAQWHNSVHALQSEPQCQLCLSSFEFEHSLPINVKLFETLQKSFTPLNLDYCSFQSLLNTHFGNRDPPLVL
ncbi:MAG: hypothetical protein ACI9UD_000540 [Glaciecola sp.]|jgi:hypothetical protein